MVAKKIASLAFLFLLCLVSLAHAKKLKLGSLADAEKLKERTFKNCLLHEVDGRIWLQQPMVYLGMLGVVDTPPFCLSNDLAKQFAPLVSRIVEKNDGPRHNFYSEGMPQLQDKEKALILLALSVEAQPYGRISSDDSSPQYYEVVKMRLLTVEFVAPDWIKAWTRVDDLLKKIASANPASQDQEKQKQLAAAIERDSRALDAMNTVAPADNFRALVQSIDPNAVLVRTFQQSTANQWQGQLRQYAARLKRGPQTILAPNSSELLAAKQKLKEKLFESCLLRRADGRIWLQEPMIYLGMVGVMDTPPFCLSDDLAKQFEPMTSNVVTSDTPLGPRSPWIFSMPSLQDDKENLTLFWLHAKMRLIAPPDRNNNNPHADEFYEIVDVRMTAAECVTGQWIRDYKHFDEALKEVVSESLTAPEPSKRERLVRIIEKGCQALNAMAQAKAPDDFTTRLIKAAPKAHSVNVFKKQLADEWQTWLERFAARLQITPASPMPLKPNRSRVFTLLAESKSQAAFASELDKLDPAMLEQIVYYSSALHRQVCVWDIPQLSDTEFEKVRSAAEDMLSQIRAGQDLWDKAPDDSLTETLTELGIVLRPASADLLAKNLILSGILVDRVSPEHESIGLKTGDIIVDYQSAYSVVMGWLNFPSRIKTWANTVKRDHKTRILRQGRMLDLALDPK